MQNKIEELTETAALREQVYLTICQALMRGEFAPGQKITIRALASTTGTSLTPVRDALNRLVAENILRGEANRSVVVPTLTGHEIRELRDIRILNEVFATKIAAAKVTKSQVEALREIAVRLNVARTKGDKELDLKAIYEFQFALYEISGMPLLLRLIRNLWLKSGPYLHLLFPDYVEQLKGSRGDWRERLCDALEHNDVEAACREILNDVNDAMTYAAAVSDAAISYRMLGKGG